MTKRRVSESSKMSYLCGLQGDRSSYKKNSLHNLVYKIAEQNHLAIVSITAPWICIVTRLTTMQKYNLYLGMLSSMTGVKVPSCCCVALQFSNFLHINPTDDSHSPPILLPMPWKCFTVRSLAWLQLSRTMAAHAQQSSCRMGGQILNSWIAPVWSYKWWINNI